MPFHMVAKTPEHWYINSLAFELSSRAHELSIQASNTRGCPDSNIRMFIHILWVNKSYNVELFCIPTYLHKIPKTFLVQNGFVLLIRCLKLYTSTFYMYSATGVNVKYIAGQISKIIARIATEIKDAEMVPTWYQFSMDMIRLLIWVVGFPIWCQLSTDELSPYAKFVLEISVGWLCLHCCCQNVCRLNWGFQNMDGNFIFIRFLSNSAENWFKLI